MARKTRGGGLEKVDEDGFAIPVEVKKTNVTPKGRKSASSEETGVTEDLIEEHFIEEELTAEETVNDSSGRTNSRRLLGEPKNYALNFQDDADSSPPSDEDQDDTWTYGGKAARKRKRGRPRGTAEKEVGKRRNAKYNVLSKNGILYIPGTKGGANLMEKPSRDQNHTPNRSDLYRLTQQSRTVKYKNFLSNFVWENNLKEKLVLLNLIGEYAGEGAVVLTEMDVLSYRSKNGGKFLLDMEETEELQSSAGILVEIVEKALELKHDSFVNPFDGISSKAKKNIDFLCFFFYSLTRSLFERQESLSVAFTTYVNFLAHNIVPLTKFHHRGFRHISTVAIYGSINSALTCVSGLLSDCKQYSRQLSSLSPGGQQNSAKEGFDSTVAKKGSEKQNNELRECINISKQRASVLKNYIFVCNEQVIKFRVKDVSPPIRERTLKSLLSMFETFALFVVKPVFLNNIVISLSDTNDRARKTSLEILEKIFKFSKSASNISEGTIRNLYFQVEPRLLCRLKDKSFEISSLGFRCLQIGAENKWATKSAILECIQNMWHTSNPELLRELGKFVSVSFFKTPLNTFESVFRKDACLTNESYVGMISGGILTTQLFEKIENSAHEELYSLISFLNEFLPLLQGDSAFGQLSHKYGGLNGESGNGMNGDLPIALNYISIFTQALWEDTIVIHNVETMLRYLKEGEISTELAGQPVALNERDRLFLLKMLDFGLRHLVRDHLRTSSSDNKSGLSEPTRLKHHFSHKKAEHPFPINDGKMIEKKNKLMFEFNEKYLLSGSLYFCQNFKLFLTIHNHNDMQLETILSAFLNICLVVDLIEAQLDLELVLDLLQTIIHTHQNLPVVYYATRCLAVLTFKLYPLQQSLLDLFLTNHLGALCAALSHTTEQDLFLTQPPTNTELSPEALTQPSKKRGKNQQENLQKISAKNHEENLQRNRRKNDQENLQKNNGKNGKNGAQKNAHTQNLQSALFKVLAYMQNEPNLEAQKSSLFSADILLNRNPPNREVFSGLLMKNENASLLERLCTICLDLCNTFIIDFDPLAPEGSFSRESDGENVAVLENPDGNMTTKVVCMALSILYEVYESIILKLDSCNDESITYLPIALEIRKTLILLVCKNGGPMSVPYSENPVQYHVVKILLKMLNMDIAFKNVYAKISKSHTENEELEMKREENLEQNAVPIVTTIAAWLQKILSQTAEISTSPSFRNIDEDFLVNHIIGYESYNLSHTESLEGGRAGSGEDEKRRGEISILHWNNCAEILQNDRFHLYRRNRTLYSYINNQNKIIALINEIKTANNKLLKAGPIGVVLIAHLDIPLKVVSIRIRSLLLTMKNTDPKSVFKIFKNACKGYYYTKCTDALKRTEVFVASIARLIGVRPSEHVTFQIFNFFKYMIHEIFSTHEAAEQFGGDKNSFLEALLPLANRHYLKKSEVADIDKYIKMMCAQKQLDYPPQAKILIGAMATSSRPAKAVSDKRRDSEGIIDMCDDLDSKQGEGTSPGKKRNSAQSDPTMGFSLPTSRNSSLSNNTTQSASFGRKDAHSENYKEATRKVREKDISHMFETPSKQSNDDRFQTHPNVQDQPHNIPSRKKSTISETSLQMDESVFDF